MASPKVIQDIRTLFTENDTQDSNLTTHDNSTTAHRNKFLTLSAISNYNILSAVRTQSASQVYTVNPIPSTGWYTATTGTLYTNNDYTVAASSYYSLSTYASNPVDDKSNNGWKSLNDTSFWWSLKLPSAVTVTKFRVNISTPNNSTLEIQGSNNNSTWSTLYTVSNQYAANINSEITLTTPGSYIYYRVYCTSAALGNLEIYKFELSSYILTTYTTVYSSTDIPSTWLSNQRVLIETPNTSTIGIVSNTLNGKTIDTILKSSTKYELVYKSNMFYAKEVI